MLKQIGGGELIIILVVLLLLFGSAKLPELARSIGKSARELRKGLKDISEEDAEPEIVTNAEPPED